MKLRRTVFALAVLILGPPLAVFGWLWVNYNWLRFAHSPYTSALEWSPFVLTMTVAAAAALDLPIWSGWLRALTIIACSLVAGAPTLPYEIVIACS